MFRLGREERTVDWLQPLEYLREHRRPGVLVTLAAVRGHAPREAGAKMVVAADRTWGTIGGGNLEARRCPEPACSSTRDGVRRRPSPSPSPRRRRRRTASSAAAAR